MNGSAWDIAGVLELPVILVVPCPWDGIFCIGTVERISGISEGQPYQRHYPEPYFANALSADERDAGSWTCGYGTSGGEDTWVSSQRKNAFDWRADIWDL